ncbi:MAG: hypothetical protein LBH79_03200 [Nitrososphaerota archaeon]|jgi:hypothetical protein|nr:hypothetical protein [Nitrososphaerota archaeon]
MFSPIDLIIMSSSSSVPEITVECYDQNNNAWQDHTNHVVGIDIRETGIQRISTAVINLEGQRSSLESILQTPHRLTRIQFRPPGTNTLTPFYGYVNADHIKTTAGTIEEHIKISLDCLNTAARLDDDTITFDYWQLQSAQTPYTTNNWTYRKMLQNILEYPDSRAAGAHPSPIAFDIDAPNNPNGIDHVIDSGCNYQTHTIFDVIRTVCDRIGYDGYYYTESNTIRPKIVLRPFQKTASAVFGPNYLREPEYFSGALSDIRNVIYVWGGIDTGYPPDGDRWTEYGYAKYNPRIWSATADNGRTATIGDYDHTPQGALIGKQKPQYKKGNRCIYAGSNGYNTQTPVFTLAANLHLDRIPDIGPTGLNALHRTTHLNFLFLMAEYQNQSTGMVPIIEKHGQKTMFYLIDNSGNELRYTAVPTNYSIANNNVITNNDYFFNLPIGTNAEIKPNGSNTNNNWEQTRGEEFDWEHLNRFTTAVEITPHGGQNSQFFLFIDSLQFSGGVKIDPFTMNALNISPVIKDQQSINNYGIHVMHLRDNEINSFEHAKVEATRVLANLKDPIPTMTFTVVPTQLLWPGDIVQVSGAYHRIKEVHYNWLNTDKKLTATYTCVNQTSPLPPIWTEESYQKYLIK